MELDSEFLQDEVRCGFFVPCTIKCSWASSLEILSDIDVLCKKYNISYFADWGTLLGAVRHGGFIPWDDDLDICMKRKDYIKFLEVSKELPSNYRLLNFYNEPEYTEYMTRVVNGSGINFDIAHLEKYHGFPFVTGIDIFVLDYIPDDEEMKKDIFNSVKELEYLEAGVLDNVVNSDELDRYLDKVDNLLIKYGQDKLKYVSSTLVNEKITLTNKIKIAIDRLFSATKDLDNSENITLMPLYFDNSNFYFPSSYYEEGLSINFEGFDMPVPACYDGVLLKKYGEYMKICKKGGSHGYPFYKIQENVLKSHNKNWIPKHELRANDINYGGRNKTAKRKDKVKEYVKILKEIQRLSEELEKKQDMNSFGVLLEKAQETAINMGEYIEKTEGEGFITVKYLEEYCELIYGITEGNNTIFDTKQCIDKIEKSVNNDIKEYKEIVFLPYKASMWDSLEGEWKKYKEDENVRTYVIPIPYFDKNPDGSPKTLHYEGELFPEDVPITNYNEYNLEDRHPDIIYIHNPYDELNYITSVHPYFYSKNIKNYTDELIYIPYFVLDEINPDDERAVANAEHFCIVPGVFHADKVIVQSENMRKVYIENLVKETGEKTRSIWEKKICGTASLR